MKLYFAELPKDSFFFKNVVSLKNVGVSSLVLIILALRKKNLIFLYFSFKHFPRYGNTK